MASTITVIEIDATTRLTRTLPSRMVAGAMGAASIRASVPLRRSASRPRTPNWAAKKTNRTAIDAP